MTRTAALIVAAGKGSRAGGEKPKQYRLVGDRPVLLRAMDPLLAHPAIDAILVVIGESETEQYTSVAPPHKKLLPPVAGGLARQDSVRIGLTALRDHAPDNVLIHDAARPFATSALIGRVVDALSTAEAVLPALPVIDTLKEADDGSVRRTISRERLYAAQTPQGFRFASILAGHERAAEAGLSFTDDTGIAEWTGIPIKIVAGEPGNTKLTTAEDIATADRRLAGEAALALGEVRVGTGYDVHAFGPGSMVMLAGIAIPHDRGLVGYSDADVALHALTDAILGALAEGDIGAHFPPSEPKWKGVSSDRFLSHSVGLVAARGGRIAHLDLAIVAEAPRIGPYREQMRERIAAICGVTIDRVAVKATTNEGLGFVGRGEGIAAIATATIRLPFAGAR